MSKEAIVAARTHPDESRHSWIRPLLTELGYAIVTTHHNRGTEHNRYNLRPETIEWLVSRAESLDPDLIALDNLLHPGQLIDISQKLEEQMIADRRDLLYRYFAMMGSQTAQNRQQDRNLAIESQRIQRIEREGNTKGRRLSDIERQRDQLADRLVALQEHRKHEIAGRSAEPTVVIAGKPLTGVNDIMDGLAVPSSDELIVPSEPQHQEASIAGFEVGCISLPPIPAGLPAWYTAIVPEMATVLREATVLVVDSFQTIRAVSEYANSSQVVWYAADTNGATEHVHSVATSPQELDVAIADLLPTIRINMQVPYTDQGHQLRAQLHDDGIVDDVKYGQQMHIVGKLLQSQYSQYEQRIESMPDATIEGSAINRRSSNRDN